MFANEFNDRSEAWIKHMLLPQVPELSRNWADLTNVLFPREQIQKLPAMKEFYRRISQVKPELAAKFFIEADGSMLPNQMTAFLDQERRRTITEIQTTILVAGSLELCSGIFNELSEDHFELTFGFNSTESGGKNTPKLFDAE